MYVDMIIIPIRKNIPMLPTRGNPSISVLQSEVLWKRSQPPPSHTIRPVDWRLRRGQEGGMWHEFLGHYHYNLYKDFEASIRTQNDIHAPNTLPQILWRVQGIFQKVITSQSNCSVFGCFRDITIFYCWVSQFYQNKYVCKKMPQSGVGSMQESSEDCLPMKGHTHLKIDLKFCFWWLPTHMIAVRLFQTFSDRFWEID